MQVKQRLRLNSIVSAIAVLVIFVVLFLSIYRVSRALETSAIADGIITTSFERLILQIDSLRSGNESAKAQLIAKHKQVGDLLKAAAEKFPNPEDKKTVSELLAIYEAIGKYTGAISENREKTGLRARPDALSLEIEDRLHRQLNMKIYETILLGGKLQKSGNEAVSSALRLAAGGTLIVLLLVSAMTLTNSWTMSRAITERIRRLADGATMIGKGDLHHRIDIKGDDEFAELSKAFNAMTEKLSGSYHDLENEIEVRKRAEDALRKAHDELDLRVQARTGELKNANESLERRVTERTTELQAANTLLQDSRLAALNMMEDALVARRQAEEASIKLQREATERKRIEVEIRNAKEEWERTFDSVPDLIAIIDDRHRVVRVNRAMARRLGREPEECVGLPCYEAVHGMNLPPEFCPHSRTLEDNGEHTAEVLEERLGGDFLVSTTPLIDQDGRMTGSVHVARDITERKRAEEALQNANDALEARVTERTEELATTVEIMLGEMAERERAEGSLQRLNRLYAVLSETNQAIVRAADRDALFRDFCRIAVEHGGFVLSWVGLVDQESGEVRMVAASGATGYLDEVRITADKAATGEGPTGISIREGTYYICNDFQNDPCTGPWHEKGRDHGICSSASIALKENDRVIGALTLYAGVQDFFDQQHVALLKQMGADISYALDNFTREISRRETEQALREETLERLQVVEALREKERMLLQQNRLAAMGEMIHNIAHQWRQPLNILGLLIQQLQLFYNMGSFSKEYLDESVNKSMGLIKHMSQTIDDFRNFFKPDKEKVEFKITEVVRKTVTLVEDGFKDQQIGIDFHTGDSPSIIGFPNEYSQVLLNILMNARDALLERRPENANIAVTISTEGERAVVTIADNAGGIAEEILGKIFDPYFTTKGPDRGTGVGLFMSKTIIEKNMNGRLSVRNTGTGAEFRIEV